MKKQNFLNGTNVFLITILALLIGFISGTRSEIIINKINAVLFNKPELNNQLSYQALDELREKLIAKYDGEVSNQALIEGASKGLVSALKDPYTVYLNSKEVKQFQEDLSGEIGGGIGAEIGFRNNYLTIVRPLKDNPAFRAGLQAGDVVVKINDQEIGNLSLEQAVAKIRGEAGTEVKLTIAREGESDFKDFKIKRAIINNPSVTMEMKDKVAVITVSRFDNEVDSLFKEKINEAKAQQAKSFVIDLRGNSGGYLGQAVKMASYWLDGDLVLIEKTNGKVKQKFYATSGNNLLSNYQTVVLTNAGSASASEIVVGALKDHKKTTVVGQKTFGKGSVQQLIELAHGGQLKVTVARWYTPNDKNIDKQGIEPDIEVDLTAEDWKQGKDTQLNKALEIINSKK